MSLVTDMVALFQREGVDIPDWLDEMYLAEVSKDPLEAINKRRLERLYEEEQEAGDSSGAPE